MARCVAVWSVVLGIVALAVPAVRAASLAEVKKKIESQAQQVQSFRQEAKMTMDMPGPAGRMTSSSTMEFLRRGKDKWVSRSDMVMKAPKHDGQPGTEQTNMTVIYDGEHIYTLTEQDGQKMAMKMKPDQPGQAAMTEPTGFAAMEKHYDLKLLSDQAVDGKETWAIEAKLRKGQGRPEEFDRIVMYYAKATGTPVKTVSYDKAGKVVSTMEVTRIETNVKIPDDRFKLPDGVQVMDMTRGMPTMPPADREDDAAEDAARDEPADDAADAGTGEPADESEQKPKKPNKAKDAAKKVLKKLF